MPEVHTLPAAGMERRRLRGVYLIQCVEGDSFLLRGVADDDGQNVFPVFAGYGIVIELSLKDGWGYFPAARNWNVQRLGDFDGIPRCRKVS